MEPDQRILKSISTKTDQILSQYSSVDIGVSTIDEIEIRINAMLDRMWSAGTIAGWGRSSIEVTDYAISAALEFTIRDGDKVLHPVYLTLRMTEEERQRILSVIHTLTDDNNLIAFNRAMKGI